MYQYVGNNGILISPICIEGAYSARLVQLIAEDGKILTKDGDSAVQSITISESAVDSWHEIDL